jgi:hypothetical protein
MHRPTAGILAIVLLLAGGVMYFGGYDEGTAGQVQGAFLRVGTVVATLWLAHPELSRMRPWMAWAAVGGLIALVFFRRLLLPVLIIAAILAVLRPRAPRSGKTGRQGDKETRRV